LSKKAIKAVKSKKTNFFPNSWAKTYFHWMNNIEPWCISRQLWWGHRIPAWYSKDQKLFVAENELEAKKQAKKFYKKNIELKRDNDVLDTWFSSSLWPFATLGWPRNTYELKRFYPTSILVTGFDIIFFWVARMMMMGNHLINKTPFSKVYVHALVRDEKGNKMSKSKGNAVDPLELIDKYGADSLRFTLISMASPGRDVKLSEDRIKGYRNFLNKIWNSNKFLQINDCKFKKITNAKTINIDVNRWIYLELEKTNNEVQKHIENFRFDEAARVIYQFVWHFYCDWYIEFLKPIFDSKNKKNIIETRSIAAFIQAYILVILHPFIPFFTEKIWMDLNLKNTLKSPLMYKNWTLPIKTNLLFKKSHQKIDWIIQLITIIRSTKVDLDIPASSFIDISIDDLKEDKKNIIKNNSSLFKRLGRISNIYNNNIKKIGINIIVDADCISLHFDKNINLSDQKLKISNKFKELENKVFLLNKKLGNNSFLKNAPKLIVEKEKNSLLLYKIELKKLNSIINSINN